MPRVATPPNPTPTLTHPTQFANLMRPLMRAGSSPTFNVVFDAMLLRTKTAYAAAEAEGAAWPEEDQQEVDDIFAGLS